LVALGWGLALLGAVYLLGRELYGALEARAAVLLLALSWPFWRSAHIARPDAAAAAFGFAAVWLFLVGRRRPAAHLFAGLALGLGVGALLVAGRFRHPADRPLLLLWLAMTACYVLLVRNKDANYLVQWYPIVCLLVAAALRRAAAHGRSQRSMLAFLASTAL